MGRLALARHTLWRPRTEQELPALLRAQRVDVVHAHNLFPLISPSLYRACRTAGVPVVQTLHNFRLACAAATFMRQGVSCEKCLGGLPWPAVVHGCYRGSRPQTAVLAASNTLQRWRGTWQRDIARYIVLSEFSRRKFVEAGLPAQRLVVKPNFVEAPVFNSSERSGFLFVGRLSAEKGIAALAEAMGLLAAQPIGLTAPVTLQVAGDGPEQALLSPSPQVQRLGNVAPTAVMPLMASSLAVLIPSICYEGFPRTLVEAFATGTPVIASRIGALAELVEHGRTGLLVPPGNAQELAATLRWAQDNPRPMQEMGARARAEYEARYTPQRNLQALLAVYEAARQPQTRLA
jgi:glycosyltransferase involved in cell wall biosynthesis